MEYKEIGIGRIECNDGVILEERAIIATVCCEDEKGEIDISRYASVEITNWGRYPIHYNDCITRDIKGTWSLNIDDIRRFKGVIKFKYLTDRTIRDNDVYEGNFRVEIAGIILETCKC